MQAPNLLICLKANPAIGRRCRPVRQGDAHSINRDDVSVEDGGSDLTQTVSKTTECRFSAVCNHTPGQTSCTLGACSGAVLSNHCSMDSVMSTG